MNIMVYPSMQKCYVMCCSVIFPPQNKIPRGIPRVQGLQGFGLAVI